MPSFSPSIPQFHAEDENGAPDPMAFMMKRMLETRTVMIFGGVDQKLAERVSAQMLYLDHVSDEPIRLLINSPGGHVESGDTIHDLIEYISAPVAVVGTGWVASIATHIFLGVPAKQRFCLPNTRFLIHQPSGGAGGKASDIAIQAEEIVKMRERIAQKIAAATGQKIARVREDIDRDYWMSTEEAKEYGILGTIIKKAGDVSF
ncbi:ATP-dependent Clp protease proteolytic subunit [Parasphingorhabdus cellanae]|uniref:ATP-dependent Clp protease proteolytic subunit n=1 Tax=Parasphingorhabdus cellanae TaxID=2806553 RepID=A0ABX7T499_9SPHN|nr:ATP-dependent Clp protease proteolytic subunit [Parasphingorhabdus cellanae]QTD56356.1 ATP-dependent Clp protease proteolytic subunit [Parasphingorhabdus cellanae]